MYASTKGYTCCRILQSEICWTLYELIVYGLPENNAHCTRHIRETKDGMALCHAYCRIVYLLQCVKKKPLTRNFVYVQRPTISRKMLISINYETIAFIKNVWHSFVSLQKPWYDILIKNLAGDKGSWQGMLSRAYCSIVILVQGQTHSLNRVQLSYVTKNGFN